jgi:hypothetical protein
MGEVLQANIFFFVTGISVIVITFLGAIALYHVIRLLRSARRVMDRIETSSEVIAGDLEQVRTYITERSFLSRIFMGRSPMEEGHVSRQSTVSSKKVVRAKGRAELKIRNEE